MGNDNGILDLETINNELMEQRNINTKPESREVVNTETIMNSGTMNTPVSAPAAMEVASSVMSDFSDLEIQDNFQNSAQPATPKVIDSRSFTHTPAEWKRLQEEERRIQEEEKRLQEEERRIREGRKRIQEEEVNNYVDSADSRDNHSESKAQKFFHMLFAFLVSIIISGVFVLINVKVYNIEYVSTLQWLMSMLPAMGLFYGFYYIAGERNMTVAIGILLIVLNEFISYFMFHAVLVHGVKEMYAELTYKEARDFVNMMKMVDETKGLYYTHFFSIFGVGSLSGIFFGWFGTMGILGIGPEGRRGYR